MALTQEQIKGRIKNIAKENKADARVLIRIYMMGKMITPIKIDISTGDVITPRAIEYDYKLMLEDRTMQLWSYNLETIIAEKMQTVQ